MTPIPFTPLYRVTRQHTGRGWHLELQKRFLLFWWRTLTEVNISLNSDTRYNSKGVEYWPCSGFNVKLRAQEMFMEWMETEQLKRIKVVV